jgi:hypothetical protein
VAVQAVDEIVVVLLLVDQAVEVEALVEVVV